MTFSRMLLAKSSLSPDSSRRSFAGGGASHQRKARASLILHLIERKRPLKPVPKPSSPRGAAGGRQSFPTWVSAPRVTLFDAAFMAQDLLTLWISQALREGRPLPEPRMDHPTPANGKAIAVAVECDADTPPSTTMTVQEAADTLDAQASAHTRHDSRRHSENQNLAAPTLCQPTMS